MGCTAGPSAIHYFEEAFPEVTPFGSKGLYHNKAEWIVDLTTKARAGPLWQWRTLSERAQLLASY